MVIRLIERIIILKLILKSLDLATNCRTNGCYVPVKNGSSLALAGPVIMSYGGNRSKKVFKFIIKKKKKELGWE